MRAITGMFYESGDLVCVVPPLYYNQGVSLGLIRNARSCRMNHQTYGYNLSSLSDLSARISPSSLGLRNDLLVQCLLLSNSGILVFLGGSITILIHRGSSQRPAYRSNDLAARYIASVPVQASLDS